MGGDLSMRLFLNGVQNSVPVKGLYEMQFDIVSQNNLYSLCIHHVCAFSLFLVFFFFFLINSCIGGTGIVTMISWLYIAGQL